MKEMILFFGSIGNDGGTSGRKWVNQSNIQMNMSPQIVWCPCIVQIWADTARIMFVVGFFLQFELSFLGTFPPHIDRYRLDCRYSPSYSNVIDIWLVRRPSILAVVSVYPLSWGYRSVFRVVAQKTFFTGTLLFLSNWQWWRFLQPQVDQWDNYTHRNESTDCVMVLHDWDWGQ